MRIKVCFYVCDPKQRTASKTPVAANMSTEPSTMVLNNPAYVSAMKPPMRAKRYATDVNELVKTPADNAVEHQQRHIQDGWALT